MRKLILSSALIIAGIFSANAQADSDLVQVGFKAGLNFSTVTGDGFDKPDLHTGFYAGFVAEVPITERFSVQPEVYYSAQGFTIGNNEFGKADYELDYIQIPVLAKIYLIKGLNVQAGPQLGFNINEKIDYDSDIGSGTIDTDDSGTQDIDVGITAGAEYKFDNGFFVQARYNYGFTELVKNQDVHNSVFQVGIGFLF